MPLKDWLENQNLHFPTPPPRQDTFPSSHTSPCDSGSLVQAQLEQPLCPVPAAVAPAVAAQLGGALQVSLG